jgi:ABC-type transport system involved in cytochrome c biogenesis permease subunit
VGYDIAEFGRLPVLLNGRVKPLDTVARNSLLIMQGRQGVYLTEVKWYERLLGKRPEKLKPIEWLLTVLFQPEEADKLKTFRVEHPDIQGILGGESQGLVYYSFNQLTNHIPKISSQAEQIRKSKPEAQTRTAYEKDLLHLHDSVILYGIRLKNSVKPEGTSDFTAELASYESIIGPGLTAIHRSEAGDDYNAEDLQRMAAFFQRYSMIEEAAYPLIIPPLDAAHAREDWKNIGTSLKESLRNGKLHPAVRHYAAMATAYAGDKPPDFNRALAQYRDWLDEQKFLAEIKKGRDEFSYNLLAPFYRGMVIYIGALLLGCAFWLNWSGWLRRSGLALLILGFVIHSIGIIIRMVLEGRPPVTNLYSSAVFVGWGIVLLGILLEALHKGGIGIVTAGVGGFVTLIVAHHLSLSGDTMEMLQAVLDTNIWLATHVVIITIGYASMFLAGLLAIIYILRGVLTRSLVPDTARALAKMVYGVICFATLFSFVGTILGGIWADQSWGRFWGWDPKENGALLIVIWCALILHARWGGMIRDRGLMILAIFGNIVTAWSWFGTNMLGVGLHSYGFMNKAFVWLMIFNVSQLLIMGLGLLPQHLWLSFRQHLPENTPGSGGSLQPSPSAS